MYNCDMAGQDNKITDKHATKPRHNNVHSYKHFDLELNIGILTVS